MTNDKTVTMSRELAERRIIEFAIERFEICQYQAFQSCECEECEHCMNELAMKELRALIAAPAVERQEPVALPMRRSWSGIAGWKDQAEIKAWNACLDEIAKLGPLYTSPPAPVSVVLPERNNASQNLDLEQCGYVDGWNACLDKVKEMNQ